MREETHETVDELQVTGALGVTVTSSVFGTSSVAGVSGHSTISLHGDEVESTVKTTGEGGEVNIEGELVVEEVEHLVGFLVLHQVHAGSDVGGGFTLSDELEGEGIAGTGDSVGGLVVGTLEGTVLGASLVVGAEGGIPLVAIVAVGELLKTVDPAPVRVNHDGSVNSSASSRAAVLPCHRRVGLLLFGTGLLAIGRGDEKGNESERTEHVDCAF